MSRVTAADLDAFVQIFAASDWDEADVRIGDVELRLSRVDGNVISRQSWTPADVGAAGHGDDQAARITAPHIATVHRGAAVGGAPRVSVGDAVTPDSVVCALQVMQRFIPLEAGMTGTIRQVCVQEGALVQHGDVLFVVDAAPASAGSE